MTLTTANWRGLDSWSKTRLRWRLIARAEQLRPVTSHLVWLYMAGRGAGKTRSGGEDASEFARTHPKALYALVAPTLGDVRNTMVEGESGLLRILPTTALRGGSVEDAWNRGTCELYLANGVEMQGFSSEKPGRLRGPQHHGAWVDEPGELKDAKRGDVVDTTWNNLLMGLRLGANPQVVATGTPKPVTLLRQLLSDAGTVVTRGTTYDNLANLSPVFAQRILAKYEGTNTGRQEIMGELLAEAEGALWKRAWIDALRQRGPYHEWITRNRGFAVRTVVALDPADGVAEGDQQALVVASLGNDGRFYVIHSVGMRISPKAWLEHAAKLFVYFRADRLVYEKNHGGRYLTELLRVVAPDLPTRAVDATEGKRTRAEPISALYEQGRVVHVGVHDELEDEMCNYTGSPKEKSPDLMDAAVWALTDLAGHHTAAEREAPPKRGGWDDGGESGSRLGARLEEGI